MLKKLYIANSILIIFSLAISIIAFEVVLRVFFPKYEYAAESKYDLDDLRIWSRRPDVHYTRQRPGTSAYHSVFYNNLALRQHRNIFPVDLLGRQTVVVFGDSMTENIRIPVQYGFVDVLDYLLNRSSGDYDVLNFGVDGYGTDQSYLYYKSSNVAKSAKHVFYLFYSNDLRNIYESSLFILDQDGGLRRLPTPEPSLFIRAISRLYITYLALEVRKIVDRRLFGRGGAAKAYDAQHLAEHAMGEGRRQRLRDATGAAIEAHFAAGRYQKIEQYFSIFLAILESWAGDVAAQGGKFHIVLYPADYGKLGVELVRRGFSVIDLYDLFKHELPGFRPDHVRLTGDVHWNELGNMYAAKNLFEFLAAAEQIESDGETDVRSWLAAYYSAFPGGWFPPGWQADKDLDGRALARVRARYLALDQALAGDR